MVWFFGSKNDSDKQNEEGSPAEESSNVRSPENRETAPVAVEDPEEGNHPPEKSQIPEEPKKDPENILKNILAIMKIDERITREDTDETIYLNINGEHGALLIGRRGQTLDSFEYLLNKICYTKQREGRKKIVLDAENYRKKREEKIIDLSQKLALKVADTKKTEFVLPMSPLERKIVHTTLKDNTLVETQSEGDGFYKKIAIIYKNGNNANNDIE